MYINVYVYIYGKNVACTKMLRFLRLRAILFILLIDDRRQATRHQPTNGSLIQLWNLNNCFVVLPTWDPNWIMQSQWICYQLINQNRQIKSLGKLCRSLSLSLSSPQFLLFASVIFSSFLISFSLDIQISVDFLRLQWIYHH